jgi:class 3 adenylate cyclase
MKNDNDLRHIPVIVISALDEMDSLVRCIEMGATDYLTKPFDPVLLRARMNASLASKRLRDIEQAHMREIQRERERADQLLLNILPAPIAEQLKQDAAWNTQQAPVTIAESFPEVTVLFADVVDFTRWAAHRSPRELLEVLNTVFSTFDKLAEKYNIEKIKTIGDEYMVASGLPIPRTDHAEAMADMALEMMAAYHDLAVIKHENLKLRIGMNSGPVIAGVIGVKKFIYDLWGDTVNTASRMQTHGEDDQIQVSPLVYERLRDQYIFTEKGQIQVKSKGYMFTYLLIGKKPGS